MGYCRFTMAKRKAVKRHYAVLEVSPACYAEVRAKLRSNARVAADDGECLDMRGLALRASRTHSSRVFEYAGLLLTVRAANMAARCDATCPAEVAAIGRLRLMRMQNCGRQTVAVIECALAAVGLELAP